VVWLPERGERLTVHIADGVRFISECVLAKKHGLIIGKLHNVMHIPQH
jgi:hypothetical protein